MEAAMLDEDVVDLYATRVENEEEDGTINLKLVVVEALSPEDARRETGLVEYDFHLATDAELAEWDDVTSRPLNQKDLTLLIYLLQRVQRDLAKRRAKDPASGSRRPPELGDESPEAVSRRRTMAARFKARKYAQLRGKLESIREGTEDDEEAGTFLPRGVS